MKDLIKIGTRRSQLALTQSKVFAEELEKISGIKTQLVGITTTGDLAQESLAQIGGTGVFAATIRQSLMVGDIDLAVHSLKDLPVNPEPGLSIVTIPKRSDARDVLCTLSSSHGIRALTELAQDAVIGTGSPRRAVQLRAMLNKVGRADIQIKDIRGNVNTRLTKMRQGEFQGIILAAAGLKRLGKTNHINMYFDPLDMMPAAGQGALAVEARTDMLDSMVAENMPMGYLIAERHRQNRASGQLTRKAITYIPALLKGLRALDDTLTRLAVMAERAVLAHLEVGCATPVGVHATVTRTRITVQASAASKDCEDSLQPRRLVYVKQQTNGPCVNETDAMMTGVSVAQQLIAEGADL